MSLKKIALVLGWFMGLAHAQESASPILDAIKQSGEIKLGYGQRGVPFTYMLPDQTVPIGFGHDLEMVIVKHLKEKLAMPDLKVSYQRFDFGNAYNLIGKGEVHFHCSFGGNIVERQKVFNFSNAYFVSTTRLLTRKDSNAKSLKEMKGKRVASLNNTWSMTFLRSKSKQFELKSIHGFNTFDEVIDALNAQQVDAFFMGDGALTSVQTQLSNPDDWHIVGKGAGSERYACLMQKGDDGLKALVDEALVKYYESGEIYKLYDKWFKQPIAPTGKSLNLEMSDATRMIFIKPTDKAIGQD